MSIYRNFECDLYWKNYFTKYPGGRTILESLCDWLTNLNDLNDKVEELDGLIDEFLEYWEDNLEETTTAILEEWLADGTLEVIISDALQTQIDELDEYVNRYDVVKLGCDNTGTTDISTVLNPILLDGDVSLYFPEGSYLVEDFLVVYENTYIELNKNATIYNNNPNGEGVFINDVYGNIQGATGYNGNGNITIKGGTMDNVYKLNSQSLSSCIQFSHSHNVLIENMTFLNNYESHFIELNSTRDSLIRNCVFSDLDGGSNPGTRHCVDIDYSYQNGFPHFGSWDGTPCRSITVENCHFYDSDSGLGNHATPTGVQHSNISFINNTFNNITSNAILAYGHINLKVKDNYSDNTGDTAYKFRSIKKSVIDGNYTYNSTANGIDIFATLVTGNTSDANEIINNTVEIASIGIRHREGTCIIRNNTIENVQQNGIYTSDTGDNTSIIGNIIIGANQGDNGDRGVTCSTNYCHILENKVYQGDYTYIVERAYGLTGTGSYLRTSGTEEAELDNRVDTGNYNNGLVQLFSGSTSTGSIALTGNITEFDRIFIQIGTVSGATFMSFDRYAFGSNKFGVTDNITYRDLSDNITTLQVTDDAELTFTTSTNSDVRRIFGYKNY